MNSAITISALIIPVVVLVIAVTTGIKFIQYLKSE